MRHAHWIYFSWIVSDWQKRRLCLSSTVAFFLEQQTKWVVSWGSQEMLSLPENSGICPAHHLYKMKVVVSLKKKCCTKELGRTRRCGRVYRIGLTATRWTEMQLLSSLGSCTAVNICTAGNCLPAVNWRSHLLAFAVLLASGMHSRPF